MAVVAALADNRNPQSLASRLRQKRFSVFLRLVSSLSHPIRILDVGGTQQFWEGMGFGEQEGVTVTLLNVYDQTTSLPNFSSVRGDARAMIFEDGTFDIVFSNSVIEHVGELDDQRKMAKEVQRVGKRYFIQTPNKYFPIEPHFLFPFFQFLPTTTKIWLLRHFDLGWHVKTEDFAKAREQVEGVKLLSKREFGEMFPKAIILAEKFCGLTKSFTACYGWEAEPTGSKKG
jgi:hypothetical protein